MRRLIGMLALLLVAGCSTTRVVPVPGAGVVLDPGQRSATLAGDGVEVVVRPSVWRGSPSYLADYVTPFHLLVVNGSSLPLRYEYGDLRLFDEARFQYTALPPAEVTRILRAAAVAAPADEIVVAGATSALHRHRGPYYWDPWWWGPPFSPYYWPPPRYDDVLTQALPVGSLAAGARAQGFVYFPRLRPDARRLTFEFHHRLGDAPRVLTLPLAVERAAAAPPRPTA
ncbi:MAG TPA: hypothetical protein VGX21_12650 [Methylomirabilota bacterium]|nr:hypothetical protein [Methylomirabilota bacterium]